MRATLRIIILILVTALLIPAIFYSGLLIYGRWHDDWSGYNASNYISDGYCNIAVVPIFGEIVTYGTDNNEDGDKYTTTNMSDTLALIGRAEREGNILGTLLLVDSSGGSGAAAHLIASEIQKSEIPNAAYILESGNSAAYLLASGADTIIASPFADVGSLGVTMSYLGYALQNMDQGIEYISLSSAKYKDYGNPEKPLTDEERALLERDLSIWHDELVKQVATNRNLPLEDVERLADGSSMPASLALEAKLIDGIGNKEAARNWFAEQLRLTPEEVVFCQ